MSLTRRVHNVETGDVQDIEVDNAWILANKPKEIQLSPSANSVAVNGSITLSAQLYTPTLLNDERNPLAEALTISLRLGDTTSSINLVNGQWSDSLQFVTVGTYEIYCLTHPSNIITIEVTP